MFVGEKKFAETSNQFRFCQTPASHFEEGSLRTKPLEGIKGVSLIVGKLKKQFVPKDGDPESMVEQSYHFDKTVGDESGWDLGTVQDWLDKHGKNSKVPEKRLEEEAQMKEKCGDKKEMGTSKPSDKEPETPEMATDEETKNPDETEEAPEQTEEEETPEEEKKPVRAAKKEDVRQKMTRQQKLDHFKDEEGNIKFRVLRNPRPLPMTVCARGANGQKWGVAKSANGSDVRTLRVTHDVVFRKKSEKSPVYYTVAYFGMDLKRPFIDAIDVDRESIEKDDLRHLAHTYLGHGFNTKMDVQHDGNLRQIKVVESFVNDPEVVNSPLWPPHAWIVGVDPSDEPEIAMKMAQGDVMSVSIMFGFDSFEDKMIPAELVPTIIDPFGGKYNHLLLDGGDDVTFKNDDKRKKAAGLFKSLWSLMTGREEASSLPVDFEPPLTGEEFDRVYGDLTLSLKAVLDSGLGRGLETPKKLDAVLAAFTSGLRDGIVGRKVDVRSFDADWSDVEKVRAKVGRRFSAASLGEINKAIAALQENDARHKEILKTLCDLIGSSEEDNTQAVEPENTQEDYMNDQERQMFNGLVAKVDAVDKAVGENKKAFEEIKALLTKQTETKKKADVVDGLPETDITDQGVLPMTGPAFDEMFAAAFAKLGIRDLVSSMTQAVSAVQTGMDRLKSDLKNEIANMKQLRKPSQQTQHEPSEALKQKTETKPHSAFCFDPDMR